MTSTTAVAGDSIRRKSGRFGDRIKRDHLPRSGAPIAVEYGGLVPDQEVGSSGRDTVPAYANSLDQEPVVSDRPSPASDDVPDDFDNLMILSPEQYEVLLKAREELGHDLSREQVKALLKELEERS